MPYAAGTKALIAWNNRRLWDHTNDLGKKAVIDVHDCNDNSYAVTCDNGSRRWIEAENLLAIGDTVHIIKKDEDGGHIPWNTEGKMDALIGTTGTVTVIYDLDRIAVRCADGEDWWFGARCLKKVDQPAEEEPDLVMQDNSLEN